MSEEQPNFKVTDRRLFNPDGTPREIERAEEPAAESSAAEATAQAAGDARAETQGSAAAAGATAETERDAAGAGHNAGRTASAAEGAPGDDYAEADVPGADDPASFVNFLMSIATNAAAAIGMMESHVTGQRGVDLELAKHWIDVLGMLRQKTRGNLVPQEQQIFDNLLADLRMQYVSLTGARQPKAPRGFTGRDIIGGK